jgi:hypothetical protein
MPALFENSFRDFVGALWQNRLNEAKADFQIPLAAFN